MSPLVQIILVNYNKPDDTIDCLRSLSGITYDNFRVMVVDNGSTMDSVEQIRSRCPEIDLVVSTRNRGFAGGNNVGIARAMEARPTFFLFLNNDTVVDPGFLTPLVEMMESDRQIGAAGGTICHFPQTEKLWYAGGRLVDWRALALHRYPGKPYAWVRGEAPSDVTFITGCLLMVRASLLERLGPFDERYFLYFEDAEFSARLRRHGYRLVYVPQSRVYHKITHVGNTPATAYYGLRSRLLYVRHCLSGWNRFMSYLYMSVTQTIRLLQWRLTRPDLFRAIMAALRDYRRGVVGSMPGQSSEAR